MLILGLCESESESQSESESESESESGDIQVYQMCSCLGPLLFLIYINDSSIALGGSSTLCQNMEK